MAVGPIRDNSALLSIITTALNRAFETPAAPPPGSTPEIPQSQPNPYQGAFNADGFDSLASKTPGLSELTEQLGQMMEAILQFSNLASGEQGAGSEGVPELGGASGAGAPTNPGQPPAIPETQQAFAPPPAGETQTPPSTQAPPSTSGNNPTGGSGNTMDFTNDGDKPMTVNFTPNAGGQQIPPMTLQPGESVRQEFPQGWNGNFRTTDGDGANATLGEVAFNGGGNNTYYDVSYIEGNNANMTITPESGGKTSGTMDNLVADAPDSIKARTADGQVYGIKKTTTSEVRDPEIVNYYRGKVAGDEGYVDPKDDASTLGTSDTHLEVHLKNVF
jgi:hypothetical protein